MIALTLHCTIISCCLAQQNYACSFMTTGSSVCLKRQLSMQRPRRVVGVCSCAQGKIADFNAGKLTLLAGCDTEQSLEHAVMGVLNRIRNTASDVRGMPPPMHALHPLVHTARHSVKRGSWVTAATMDSH